MASPACVAVRPLSAPTLGGLLLSVVVVLAFVVPAAAWEVENTNVPRTVRFWRSAEDTAAETIAVITGGTPPTAGQYANSSWDETSSGSPFFGCPVTYIAVESDDRSFDFTTNTQALLFVGGDGKRMCVLMNPNVSQPVYLTSPTMGAVPTLPVSVVSTPVAVSVLGTLPVSQVASVAMAGTVTVDPYTVAGISPEAAGISFMMVLGALGYFFASALSKVAGGLRARLSRPKASDEFEWVDDE